MGCLIRPRGVGVLLLSLRRVELTPVLGRSQSHGEYTDIGTSDWIVPTFRYPVYQAKSGYLRAGASDPKA